MKEVEFLNLSEMENKIRSLGLNSEVVSNVTTYVVLMVQDSGEFVHKIYIFIISIVFHY